MVNKNDEYCTVKICMLPRRGELRGFPKGELSFLIDTQLGHCRFRIRMLPEQIHYLTTEVFEHDGKY